MLDLEPINARLAAATPGPWHVEPEDTACGSFVARMPGIYIEPEHQHLAPAGNDAALIANAPADIAALVAEVERLTQERDEARDAAGEYLAKIKDAEEDLAEVERLRALIRGVASGLTTYGRADEAAELLAMADGVPYVRDAAPTALQSEGATPEVTP